MKLKSFLLPLLTIAVVTLTLWCASAALAPTAQKNTAAEETAMLASLLPSGAPFEPEAYSGEDENIAAVYRGTGGYVIETHTAGYAGDVTLLVGVSDGGTVTGLVTRRLSETYGLGWSALRDTTFLRQFLRTSGDATVGETVDAISGATVTSKAVAKGVNSAVAFVTGADISSGATQWGG